jgi:hypothetical protein
MDQKVSQGLEYLHDCVLLEMKYDAVSEDRKLSLLLKAPDDLGYAPWDGQQLSVTADDVYFLQSVMWGHVAGAETLDAWNEGISDATQQDLDRHTATGLKVPALKYTITFHSGSYLELVCEDIAVDVGISRERASD